LIFKEALVFVAVFQCIWWPTGKQTCWLLYYLLDYKIGHIFLVPELNTQNIHTHKILLILKVIWITSFSDLNIILLLLISSSAPVKRQLHVH